jgi:hypothetical protein
MLIFLFLSMRAFSTASCKLNSDIIYTFLPSDNILTPNQYKIDVQITKLTSATNNLWKLISAI